MKSDIICNSIKHNKLVLWEEIARDGAQAKTILNADQRIKIAKNHCQIFAQHAKDHLVFAVGFPTVGEMEFETIRKVVDQVSECSLVTHGRITKRDVDMALKSMKGAAFPRISFFFPVSEVMCKTLMKQTPQEVLDQSLEIIKYATDKTADIPIDIALADVSRANFPFLVHTIGKLAENGIGVAKLCDSIGSMFPDEASALFSYIVKHKPDNIQIGCHMHNDFGFAQENNLKAIHNGINLIATSWLGLAERNGLQPSEQLLFLLGNENLKASERLFSNPKKDFFYSPLNLKYLYPIANRVSEYTGVPLIMTHGIIGPGVNSLSTGTPFTDPKTFRPFDPKEKLGIDPKVYITHLASKKLVEHIAESLGHKLNDTLLDEIMKFVKSEPYKRHLPIISRDELKLVIEWKKNLYDVEFNQ